MATVTVRVVPRSGRRRVEADATGVVIHVRAAPEAGRATREAAKALAAAIGVPVGDVALRTGSRSRTKVFSVRGLDAAELEARLRRGG